jgi:hypothetical protein
MSSQQQLRRIISSSMQHHVVNWKSADVSEEHVTFNFRVEKYEKKKILLPASFWFLACLILQLWKLGRHVPLKIWLTFKTNNTELHSRRQNSLCKFWSNLFILAKLRSEVWSSSTSPHLHKTLEINFNFHSHPFLNTQSSIFPFVSSIKIECKVEAIQNILAVRTS